MEPIILASESKRRQEYFKLLGLPFTCMPSYIDETLDKTMDIMRAVEDLAQRKVKKVLEMLKNENPLWVLGADTVIDLDGKVYGKPIDREDARFMINAFQGRSHQVITAMALYNGRKREIDCLSVSSNVSFAPLSEGEIEWYLDSGDWEGVAGAYKIQGLSSCFITGISGSFSSIVGLPLREFYAMLRDNGYPYGG